MEVTELKINLGLKIKIGIVYVYDSEYQINVKHVLSLKDSFYLYLDCSWVNVFYPKADRFSFYVVTLIITDQSTQWS